MEFAVSPVAENLKNLLSQQAAYLGAHKKQTAADAKSLEGEETTEGVAEKCLNGLIDWCTIQARKQGRVIGIYLKSQQSPKGIQSILAMISMLSSKTSLHSYDPFCLPIKLPVSIGNLQNLLTLDLRAYHTLRLKIAYIMVA
ncbi:hypothetical protein V6N11_022950 [Hibiscus sabdariffa]|uniref:Uncharacterized protein n=1 Tax=Hibiscus sabdariffa TaxID=183260 RepID=A0ABR2TL32_9ROSI